MRERDLMLRADLIAPIADLPAAEVRSEKTAFPGCASAPSPVIVIACCDRPWRWPVISRPWAWEDGDRAALWLPNSQWLHPRRHRVGVEKIAHRLTFAVGS